MFVLSVDDEIDLRLHDAHNVDAFFALIDTNRAFIGKWLDWTDQHQTRTDTFRYILWERKQFAAQKQITTQIYYQGQIAGSVSLMLHDLHLGFAEIGYWLGASFTGKGIVTRAVRAICNFAFNTLNLHKVIIRAMVGNSPSIAVAKRLNFTFEGLQIKQRLLRGEYHDFSVHYMLKDDWSDRSTPYFRYQVNDQIELRPLMPYQARAIFKGIDTHRLTLRQWVDWVDTHTSLEDTDDYIENALDHYGMYDGLDVGIWYDSQFCGQVNFNSWSLRNYKADLGYWLLEPYQGKGIITQAVRAMLRYGFDVVGLHRIELLCAVENAPSRAVAERLNFTHEGIMRRGERIRHHYFDVHVYALLEDDWQAMEGQ